MWQPLVDCCKSTGHEKLQCLEDYHKIFGYTEVYTKMILRLLNDDQMEHYMQVCQDIIEQV